MTALAMIIGMLPMSLGLGEGGEQNAPLGRAVIGGLVFATIATLFFVPVVFSFMHRNHQPAKKSIDNAMNSTHLHPAPPAHPIGPGREIVIVLVLIGLAIGLVPRWLARQKLARGVARGCRADRERVFARAAKAGFQHAAAGGRAGLHAGHDSRARQRLFEKLVVDIGDHVTNGQVLAEIDTPELDQQIAQAKAELDQAKAALDLAKITADRWTELLKTASVSEQETAEKIRLRLKKADVEAAQRQCAAAGRTLKNFDRVTAPFDGTVTRAQHGHRPADCRRQRPGIVSAWRKPIRCACMSACRSRSFTPSRPARRPS
jgi:hypothetical protein